MIACVVEATCDCNQPDCPQPDPTRMIVVLFANPIKDKELVQQVLDLVHPHLDDPLNTYTTVGDDIFQIGRSIVQILRIPEMIRKMTGEEAPPNGPSLDQDDFSDLKEVDPNSFLEK